ncbi:hypothetical protein [Ruminococcus sp.]|uniref:hypothetical protein n=1 Tax=Ruminococcus sp. TaxID=41978 RepID=UPI0025ECD4BC|nr:hypothetical protein [Ruminococcus sp.]
MKQRKLVLTLTILGIASVFLLTGCADETNTSESSTETAAETTAETTEAATETTAIATTTEPEEVLKSIGDPAEGDTVFAVHLINATGQSITGVSIKKDSQENFSDNLLGENDVFLEKEERVLYYNTADSSEGTDDAADATYTVLLTFEEGTTAELHQFPFDDMESGQIKSEDSVAFLVYTSLESGIEISTKEEELDLIEEIAAQKEAEEQQRAVEEAAAQQDQASNYEAPVYEDVPEQVPENDVPSVEDVPQEDPNAGCLGDEGLFY